MARTRVNATPLARTGIAAGAEVDGDTSNGHVISNTGKTTIEVRNADSGGAHSVTFVTPGTVDGQAVGDRTVSIPASSTRRFGRFQTSIYGSSMVVTVDSSQLKLTAYEP